MDTTTMSRRDDMQQTPDPMFPKLDVSSILMEHAILACLKKFRKEKNMPQNIFPKNLLECSISLKTLGIKEVAFDQEHVFDAINWCQTNKNIILGGDVYKMNGLSAESLGDSWYFEPNNSASDHEVSCKKAAEYIRKYIGLNKGRFAFSLVIKVN